jgi:hypothetical protein
MFRFTIRDVLWLTVVVAVGVGWWSEHRRYELVRGVGDGLEAGDYFEVGQLPNGALVGGFTKRGGGHQKASPDEK